MKNIKVCIKLLWPHIVILLLLVSDIIVSLVSFTNLSNQAEALYHGSFTVKSAADLANENIEEMQISVFRAISNDSQDITGQAITDAGNALEITQEQVALFRQNTLGDPAIITRLEKYLSELTPMQEHVLSLAAQNKKAEAAEYMESRNIPIINEAQEELAQLIQSADAKEAELVASLRKTQRNTIILLISLGAFGVLFSIVVGIHFAISKKGDRARLNLCKRHGGGV